MKLNFFIFYIFVLYELFVYLQYYQEQTLTQNLISFQTCKISRQCFVWTVFNI